MRFLIAPIFTISFTLLLTACVTTTNPTTGTTTYQSPRVASELAQGKRDFDTGYYKSAMRELLPLACDGTAEAQYAVGYMYYYGNGVAQDTDVGYFWIKRSADQNYGPANKALSFISANQSIK